MKRTIVLIAAALALSAPMAGFAMDHGMSHDPADVQCAKDCDMLLKNCAREADSIQQQVKKLKAAIKKDGADQKTLDELRALDAKLKEANEMLKALSKPGR
jgi:Skp family chaperone for outer membrane proteins